MVAANMASWEEYENKFDEGFPLKYTLKQLKEIARQDQMRSSGRKDEVIMRIINGMAFKYLHLSISPSDDTSSWISALEPCAVIWNKLPEIKDNMLPIFRKIKSVSDTTFLFHIQPRVLSMIKNGLVRVELHSYMLDDPSTNELSDRSIIFNGRLCERGAKFTRALSNVQIVNRLEVNHHSLISPHILVFVFVSGPDFIPVRGKSVLNAPAATVQSTDSITKMVPTMSTDNALNHVIGTFVTTGTEDDDVIAVGTRIKLICPISLKRIHTPARTVTCHHLECFDLSTFIDLNVGRNSQEWSCPVCDSPADAEKLCIDPWTTLVLKWLSPDQEEIDVQPDGSYNTVAAKRDNQINGKRKRQAGYDDVTGSEANPLIL